MLSGALMGFVCEWWGVAAGDSWGNAHFVDLRSKKKVGSRAIHKKSKVSLSPPSPSLLPPFGHASPL